MATFEHAQPISLKGNASYGGEKAVQDYIASNPSVLQLGTNIKVEAREKLVPSGGRLDFLLSDDVDGELETLYEVEVQLGDLDPSHIIRAIEYWQLEKKGNPDYKHVAVIVAENITSRYFHVLAAISESIPLVAIQMHALKFEEHVAIDFVKLLDSAQTINAIDVQRINTPADRAYWQQKSNQQSMNIVDSVFDLMHQMYPNVALKYNQGYIGTTVSGSVSNFVTIRPRKSIVRLSLHISKAQPEIDAFLKQEPHLGSFFPSEGRYRLSLSPGDLEQNKEMLRKAISIAYSESILNGSEPDVEDEVEGLP